MNKYFLISINLITTVFLFYSVDVQAHEGHEHSHPLAWLVHTVWGLSIIALGYIALTFVRSRMQASLKKLELKDAL